MSSITSKRKSKKYLKDSTLSLVVLNVGDGDSIIIRFPFKYGEKACAVVDCYNADKTIAALKALGTKTIPFRPSVNSNESFNLNP